MAIDLSLVAFCLVDDVDFVGVTYEHLTTNRPSTDYAVESVIDNEEGWPAYHHSADEGVAGVEESVGALRQY
jgi:hypothetical protein